MNFRVVSANFQSYSLIGLMQGLSELEAELSHENPSKYTRIRDNAS